MLVNCVERRVTSNPFDFRIVAAAPSLAAFMCGGGSSSFRYIQMNCKTRTGIGSSDLRGHGHLQSTISKLVDCAVLDAFREQVGPKAH
jgi:hypothetical protein